MKPLPPVIAFAHTRWTSLWMNRQHLLSRLAARGHRVAYSNGITHYSKFGHVPLFQTARIHDHALVQQPGFWMPGTHRLSILKRIAIRHHCAIILRELGIPAKMPVIGLCFDPDFIDYIDILKPAARAFHIYDSYNKMESTPGGFEATRQRIQHFDLITASSEWMFQDVIGCSPEPRFVVSNGVDYRRFSAPGMVSSQTAEAIRKLPGKKVGYVGSLNTKVDVALVYDLAREHATTSFVFVGPVRAALLKRHGEAYAAYERLCRLPNVHFFKEIPGDEVPAVAQSFDVLCIFFRVDGADWVSSGYPLKLNEYLATGKPVLSSPLKVVTKDIADVVQICRTPAEWSSALRRCTASGESPDRSEARRALARANDWDERVRQYEALLAELLD